MGRCISGECQLLHIRDCHGSKGNVTKTGAKVVTTRRLSRISSDFDIWLTTAFTLWLGLSFSYYGLPGHNAKLHPKSRLSEGRDPLPVAMKRTVTPYQTSRIEYQMLCKKSILIFTLLCVTEVGWMINEADLRPALAGERQRLSFTALPLPQRSEASVTRCVAMEVLPKQPALSRNSLPEPDRTQQAVVAIAHWGGPASRRV